MHHDRTGCSDEEHVGGSDWVSFIRVETQSAPDDRVFSVTSFYFLRREHGKEP